MDVSLNKLGFVRGSTETTVQMSLQFLTAVLVMSVVSCDVIFCVSFAHF